MMNVQDIISLSDKYCERHHVARSTLSRQILNDGKGLDRLANGGDLMTRNYEKVIAFFREHMPDALPDTTQSPLINP